MSETLFELYEIEDRGAPVMTPADGDLRRREASTGTRAMGEVAPRSSAPRSLETARAERDDAMQRVSDHAPVEWKDEAWTFLTKYLGAHAELFPDDLWAAGLTEPPNARALGPLIKRAARDGLIVKTDRTRQRTRGHATPAVVWRSLTYREESST